jgi:putative nucleotidyltransferase with HDIG domain
VIRILFVDDEVSVRQAMQRTLHHMRNEWSMTFAESGGAALQALAAVPADVLVTDMRMPGMDGWELLTETKRRCPGTVRLILSGHAEASSIMRAVGTAHQYLAKPCDSAALKAAISEAYALRELLSSERLAHLVGRVGLLPSLPQGFQELLECLRRPDASIADAARIISRDVAMTANVVKLVNSAFFGLRQPITTADRAVAHLGLDTIGALVLGHGAFNRNVPSAITGFSLEDLWRHSLEVGAAARSIALLEKFSQAEADEAFLAGMLHDVGKIVFATRPAMVSDSRRPSEKTAWADMQTHHAEVGAYLLGLWGFPNSIVAAVAYHHADRAGGEGLSLQALIHFADALVHRRHAAGADSMAPPILLQELDLQSHWPLWSAELQRLDIEGGAP